MNYVAQFDLGTELPKNFYESKLFKQLRNNLENSRQSYFLTGKAGTGKSTFVEYFRLNTKKNVMILAFTGIVSIKCRGRTIHSFFNYPHHILKRKDCKILRNQDFLKSLNTLIIDEVSMVNPNLMDAIDRSLKVNRKNDYPFGGVQMLLVGDIFQLAPIAKDKEKEVLDRLYPEGNFFFNSKSFKILNPKRIEFERIFRQKDLDFIQKLENIRRNQLTNEVLDFFNKRVIENNKKENKDDSSNYQERLSKLQIKYPLIFKNWKDEDGINYHEPRSKTILIYPNHNKRWSSEEDNKLRRFIKIQKCIYEISTIFKRKPSAIRGRILKFEEESLNDLSNGLILLAPTNRRTYQVNHKKLDSLESSEFSYMGKVTGSFKLSDMMSEKNLKLKVGAQVMLTKNDPNGRWVNGTIGFVDKLEKDKIFVKVGKKVFQVEKALWEKFDYIVKNGKFEPKVIGKFEQYPIKLAWAATIHKCQGQTFEKAVIDFDSGSFAHGMTYVALSRVKSLDGLHLIRPIRFSDVRFDERIYNFQKTVELLLN